MIYLDASQEEAVAHALQLAEEQGGTRVHVFGPKDLATGEYGSGEVVCSPAFEGVPAEPGRVVYHPEVAMLTGGGWACAFCGRLGGRPAGRRLSS